MSTALSEADALRRAIHVVLSARLRVAAVLPDMYAWANSYASEIESLVAHMEETVRVLNDEPIE
jgi:hypothetical protein